MGGDVKVESKVGHGSTFSMNFKVMCTKEGDTLSPQA
jgi:signal transduction histidine kinase